MLKDKRGYEKYIGFAERVWISNWSHREKIKWILDQILDRKECAKDSAQSLYFTSPEAHRPKILVLAVGSELQGGQRGLAVEGWKTTEHIIFSLNLWFLKKTSSPGVKWGMGSHLLLLQLLLSSVVPAKASGVWSAWACASLTTLCSTPPYIVGPAQIGCFIIFLLCLSPVP